MAEDKVVDMVDKDTAEIDHMEDQEGLAEDRAKMSLELAAVNLERV